MIKASIDHLKKNNMTYVTHLIFACGHGIKCIKAGLFLIIHSIIPVLFPKTGSNLINTLNNSFIDHNEYLLWLKNKDKNHDV